MTIRATRDRKPYATASRYAEDSDDMILQEQYLLEKLTKHKKLIIALPPIEERGEERPASSGLTKSKWNKSKWKRSELVSDPDPEIELQMAATSSRAR